MTLAESLKKDQRKQTTPKTHLWQGPCSDGPNGGITQSAIQLFLSCRERFRIRYIEGLVPVEKWEPRSGYGNMWHVCEQSLAEGDNHHVSKPGWNEALKTYAQQQCQQYRLQQEQVVHWYEVCKVQFPMYIKFWAKHPDVMNRTPLLAEQVFDVPYQLPSGRTVRLRGKWDSVDLVGKGKDAAIWLMENKTKGTIDEEKLKRQLSSGMDLQTMLYCGALLEFYRTEKLGFLAGRERAKFQGVRYNVIRRPLSGGKGTIKQGEGTEVRTCSNCEGTGRLKTKACGKCIKGMVAGKPPETKEAFYGRLAAYIEEEPGTYFMRWNVPILPSDIDRFRRECLDPILEQLCDWYEGSSWFNPFKKDGNTNLHFRTPYGSGKWLDEYDEYAEFLNTGSTVGLERVTKLFPELA